MLLTKAKYLVALKHRTDRRDTRQRQQGAGWYVNTRGNQSMTGKYDLLGNELIKIEIENKKKDKNKTEKARGKFECNPIMISCLFSAGAEL